MVFCTVPMSSLGASNCLVTATPCPRPQYLNPLTPGHITRRQDVSRLQSNNSGIVNSKISEARLGSGSLYFCITTKTPLRTVPEYMHSASASGDEAMLDLTAILPPNAFSRKLKTPVPTRISGFLNLRRRNERILSRFPIS